MILKKQKSGRKDHQALNQAQWRDRVLPLPREIRVEGMCRLLPRDVRLECEQRLRDPAYQTAVRLLRPFARGTRRTGCFSLRLGLADTLTDPADREITCRLRGLPHSEQAYAIVPLADASGLLLTADTTTGILNAARTLAQLLGPAVGASSSRKIEVPLVRVLDWPDIPQRGQWGGNSESDLAWTSQWKLNLLEAFANCGAKADGTPLVRLDPGLLRQGATLGVNVVPFIVHLEQIARYAGLMKRNEFHNTPEPGKPLPSDYTPGLCCSQPATQSLIAGWIECLARLAGVREVCVWLSEGPSPCFCPRCSGKESFGIEVRCIVDAFRSVQRRHPDLLLRILTSQGSYPVNGKILAELPADIRVTYYDGGRTYTSRRVPIIEPVLERHAASGGWLGCYPQITHSWRTVFPWTAPQFLRFRANEFAQKKLSGVTGYAVPSNRFHEFNVAALAEWAWNARGRTPREFARAYATIRGITAPDRFARWAEAAGAAGWVLAETNLLCQLIYDPALGLNGAVPFDHRFQDLALSSSGGYAAALTCARKARDLARQAGEQDMLAESECLLAGLRVFGLLRELGASLQCDRPFPPVVRRRSARLLEELDRCAMVMCNRLLEWGERVRIRSGEKRLPTRLLDTAFVLFRTCDAFRARAAKQGIVDPHPQRRQQTLGAWSAVDFAGSIDPVLRFDLTDRVPAAGGRYALSIDFLDSAFGTTVEEAVVVGCRKGRRHVLARSPDCPDEVSIWERWAEVRLDIPARSRNVDLWLETRIRGLPPDAEKERRTCSGTLALRVLPAVGTA